MRLAAGYLSGAMTTVEIPPQDDVKGEASNPAASPVPDTDKESDANAPPPTPEQLRFQRYSAHLV